MVCSSKKEELLELLMVIINFIECLVLLRVIQRELVLTEAVVHDALLSWDQMDLAEPLYDLSLWSEWFRSHLVFLLEHTPSNKPQHLPCQLLRNVSLSREHPQASLQAGITTSLPSDILRQLRLGDDGTLPFGTLLDLSCPEKRDMWAPCPCLSSKVLTSGGTELSCQGFSAVVSQSMGVSGNMSDMMGTS